MDKGSDVPQIWRHQQQATNPSSWVKDSSNDVRRKLESPRLGISYADINIYGLMWQWPSWKERALFYLGLGGQVALATGTALGIPSIVRARFYLSGTVAGFSSAYVSASIGVMGVLAIHDAFVVGHLFSNQPYCLSCIQVRQAMANIGLAVIFPAIILIPDCLYHAARDPHYPTSVPEFGQFKRMFKFVSEKYRGPIMRQLGWFSLAHILVTSIGVYMEAKAANRVSLTIDDEPDLLNEHLRKRVEGPVSSVRRWWEKFSSNE